jgi:hypothetical protein
MSYASDMGHDIPNDEDYCGITDRYMIPNERGGYTAIECNTPKTIALAATNFSSYNSFSNIIPRSKRMEEDELYADDWFSMTFSKKPTKTVVEKLDTNTIIKKDEYIFNFGKYKNKSLSYVKENDSAYILWALENVEFFRKAILNIL